MQGKALITTVRWHAAVFITGIVACVSALAGERAQVDLSVSVEMTPARFVPGGHNLFSVTVHNAGPDDAGSSNPDEKPVRVFGSTIVFLPEVGPPLEIVGVLSGDCWIDRYSEPLPNGNWVIEFDYFFDPIAAGASRTCTSDIYFSAQAAAQIVTNWRVTSSNDTDPNPSNNRFDYTFVATQPVQAAPVPALSPTASLILGFGLLLSLGLIGSSRRWDGWPRSRQ